MANYIDELSRWSDTVTTAESSIPNSMQSSSVFIHNRIDKFSWTVVRKTHDAPIKKVIFNDPATIVFWDDGSKTVVKCSKNDIYDREKGLAMAIAKYCLGNNGKLKSIFKKFVKDE